MAEKNCASCGETNLAENNFCVKCGSSDFKQQQSSPEPVARPQQGLGGAPSEEMVLSEADRRRIHEEEKTREEAREQLKSGRERRKLPVVGIGWLVVIAVFALILGRDFIVAVFETPPEGRAACQSDAIPIPARWASSPADDTNLVVPGDTWAGWADKEVCVKGQVTWSTTYGGKLSLTGRALYYSDRPLKDNPEWNAAKTGGGTWEFIGIVTDVPVEPFEVTLAPKLSD